MGDNPFLDLIREEGETVGLEKGREEGRAEGVAAARRAIARVLDKRFGAGPAGAAVQRLQRIESLAILETLFETAALCGSIEDFIEALSDSC